MKSKIEIIGIKGIDEIKKGDHVPSIINDALLQNRQTLNDGDILVIAQKIISKAEGRLVDPNDISPSKQAYLLSEKMIDRDATLIQLILEESRSIVKLSPHVLITEHNLGLIMANAGIDSSNVIKNKYLLLPKNPDESARKIRSFFKQHFKIDIAVIIADTFGRPWRIGQTNVAIGISGIHPLKDYTNKVDSHGNCLKATKIAQVDEIASSAELVMGKTDGIPVAIVRGVSFESSESTIKSILRDKEEDLFR